MANDNKLVNLADLKEAFDTLKTNASQSAAGLMSATDKTKLDGIASGAQVNSITGVKGNSESSYRTGNVNITAANIGLGNVENKSSATIRGELTKANVTTALGYTPPTTDTNTWRPIGKTSSDAAAGNTVIADSTARTISAGTSSAYSVTNLTADHVVAAWRFSGDYSENNPPADITVTTANGSYTIQASNLLASGITMQPVFIKP